MHTRVVPPSKQRGYDLDGYEEYALIGAPLACGLPFQKIIS